MRMINIAIVSAMLTAAAGSAFAGPTTAGVAMPRAISVECLHRTTDARAAAIAFATGQRGAQVVRTTACHNCPEMADHAVGGHS